jgi:hypothetical protein
MHEYDTGCCISESRSRQNVKLFLREPLNQIKSVLDRRFENDGLPGNRRRFAHNDKHKLRFGLHELGNLFNCVHMLGIGFMGLDAY